MYRELPKKRDLCFTDTLSGCWYHRVAARRRRAVAYQAAKKQRPLGCCFLALRLSAFANKRPPTVRLVRDVRWAGAGVFTPPLGFCVPATVKRKLSGWE